MALTKETIENLRQEANSLQVVLDKLRSEISELQAKFNEEVRAVQAKRQAVLAKIAAINQIMGVPPAPAMGVPPASGSSGSSPIQVKGPLIEQVSRMKVGIVGATFRETVLNAVRSGAGPMTPRDVEAAFEQSDFKDNPEAITPLRVRIGNELYKLVANGTLRRDEAGYVVAK